jgi:diguanylate cyclase (GGDEF)-like protein/PAS domain S-box-containing protein
MRWQNDGLARTRLGLEEEVARLAESSAFAESAINGAGPGIVVYDRSFAHRVWNGTMEKLTGWPASEVIGQGALKLFPELRDLGIADAIERALAGETVSSPDYLVPGGRVERPVWVAATYSPRRDASGAIVGVIGIVQDVGDRRLQERISTAMEPQFRTLVEQSLVGMYVIQDGRFQYVNPRFAAIFGYSPSELLALDSVLSLVTEEDRPTVASNIRKRIEGELRTVRYGFRAIRKNSEPIEVEVHGSATELGGKPAVIGTLLDVTDRKRDEARIVEQAYNDPLTKLPNRFRFLERLEIELAQARRHHRRLAIVYLDVDRFKFINDTRGHTAGDNLLQLLALRLKRRLRQVDTVARVGGDEFVILMPDTRGSLEMSAVAHKLLAVIQRPFQMEGQNLKVTASLGIASFPEDGDESETLLRNADAAMYRAKELGRNNFQLCTPDLTRKAVERLALQSGVRQALEREEFVLHYQPIVSLVTGRVVGLEALVRWEHPERGLVMPGSFVAVAEETGLIVPLGEWVMKAAARQLTQWHRAGLPDLRIAVNVSARQFREDNLVQMVGQAISEAGLEPHHLEVEITESIAMESAEIVVANLRMLRGMGVGIVIDDFGTGYSSLNYLKRYPITALKIDRSFVTDLPTSPADAGIVRAIAEMAHGMKLSVVAEGVENKEQFLRLQEHGCDEMQGNWVSPPLTAGGVDHLLREELKLWRDQE